MVARAAAVLGALFYRKTAVPRATRLFGALFSARVLPAGCVFDLQMQYAI